MTVLEPLGRGDLLGSLLSSVGRPNGPGFLQSGRDGLPLPIYQPALALPDPLEIFGLSRTAAWLKPEDYVAGSWADATGNLTLLQATPAQQPVAAAGINGRTTVFMDGVNDFLTGSFASQILIGTRPRIFLVVCPVVWAQGAFPFWFALTTGLVIDAVVINSGATQIAASQQSPTKNATLENPISYTPHLYEISYEADVSKRFFTDGVAKTLLTGSGTHALASTKSSVLLGHHPAGGWTATCGHWGDILILRDQPTPGELSSLYAWVGDRWGIPLP